MEKNKHLSGSQNFARVYRQLFPGAYRYVFRIIGVEADAEQITQQAFLELFGYYRNGSEAKNPTALIYRILHHRCIDAIRERSRKRKGLPESMIPAAERRRPEQVYEEKLRRETVRDALCSLALRDQRCLLLYQEGFSYREIAEILKIRENSVGKILTRAAARLKVVLKKKGELKNGVDHEMSQR